MPFVRVVGGIIWRDGRFLAACRAEGKPHAGWWEFPGGKIESGETAETALIRELDEELGIKASAPVFFASASHHYPDKSVELEFFEVRVFDGEPTPDEGQELRWVTPEEACALPFLPPDVPIVEQLARISDGGEPCI